MNSLATRFAVRMRLVSVVLGGILFLATPVTYFVANLEDLKVEAQYLSLEVARKLRETVKVNPELWEYSVMKFLKIYDEVEGAKVYRVRIYDEEDRLLEAQAFGSVPWLWSTGSSDIEYNNVHWGRVEVDRRGDAVLFTTLAIGGIFFVLGTAAALFLFFYPTRIVRNTVTNLTKTLVQLQKEAREKEVLLLEVHHRVKNSLQLISSMIGLKLRRTENIEAREILENVRHKIRTVGAVHEYLYRGSTFEIIDMQAYLEQLLQDQPGDLDGGVQITRSVVTSARFPLVAAMPVGLIVSELVMNCRKYAFVGRKSGHIDVELVQPVPDEWRLTVRDDGVGFDPTQLGTGGEKLGYILVQSLARQLQGNLDYEVRDGVTVTVSGIRVAQNGLADS